MFLSLSTPLSAIRSLSLRTTLSGVSVPFRLTKLSAACALGILFATASPISFALDGNLSGGRVDIAQGTELSGEDVYGYYFFGTADAQGGQVTVEGTISNGGRIAGGRTQDGDAIENSVLINAAKVESSGIYGGYGQGAHGNRVELKNASTVTSSLANRSLSIYGAVIQGESEGFDNQVFVSGHSSVEAALYGARATGADLSFNTVTVTDSEVNNTDSVLHGAYSETGHVYSNIVSISNSIVSTTSGESVVGGRSDEGSVSENSVIIVDQSTVTGDVIGGYAPNASANSNHVEISDSTVNGNIFGGKSHSGESNNNCVTIKGNASIQGRYLSLYGGYSEENSANFNTVQIAGDAQLGDVQILGGFSGLGHADNNRVIIKDQSIIQEAVIGGLGKAGAKENVVQIDGGEVRYDVFGGSGQQSVSNNSVLINAGDIGSSSSALIVGGYGTGDSKVQNNQVIIKGGKIQALVIGGNIANIQGNIANQGEAFGNVVIADANALISSDIYGARYRPNITAAPSEVKVYDNKVLIAGSTEVRADVYGAYSRVTTDSNIVSIQDKAIITGDVYGGHGGQGASHNSVWVTGGTVKGKVYGGYTESGNATDNTVVLHAKANLSQASIYGGFSEQFADTSSNQLVIADSGVIAQSINNFDSVDINVTDLNQTSLTLTDQDSSTLNGAKLRVRFNAAVAGSQTALEKGTKVSIIDSADTTLDFSEVSVEGDLLAKQGVSLVHQFELSEDGTSATLVSTKVNQDTSIFSAAQMGMMGLLTQANDFATSQALLQAREVAAANGHGLYFAASGENLRFDANRAEEVDLDAMHWVLGATNRLVTENGQKLDLNLYFEAGSGDVDSDRGQVSGSGDSTYYGVGALVRYEQTTGLLSGFYSQVNAELGRASMDFDSSLSDVNGARAGFDKETTYFGAGATLGYLVDLPNQISLDLIASYQWMRLKGFSDSVANDSYRFNDINSHRTIVALRAAYTGNSSIRPYASLAWEHEFDTQSDIKTYGLNLDELSLKGDTGSAQLGVRYKPSANASWSIDASVKGLIGQKEGFAGNVLFNWAF